MMLRGKLLITISAAIMLSAPSVVSAAPPETANVMEQGGVVVRAEDGAQLVRQPNGFSATLTMPAPVSGDYVYPDGTTPGSPEVFTLWAFVFNHPEHCTGPCDGDDLANLDVKFGAYNVAGHVNAGKSLTLSGHIKVGAQAGGPPGSIPHPLSNPAGAEIHFAVTSHGGLDAATLPGEFRRPTGSPMCGCWWLATFK